MNRPRPKLIWLLYAALAGALLYAGMFFKAINSEAFAFAREQITSSPVLRQRLGTITQVWLKPIGGYHEKTAGSSVYARMLIQVDSSSGSDLLDVLVTRIQGEWEVKDASIDGQPLRLVEPVAVVKPEEAPQITPGSQTSRYGHRRRSK